MPNPAIIQPVVEFCSRYRAIESNPNSSENRLWAAVRAAGSELWLDSGEPTSNAAVWSREFSGLTTNSNLLNQNVQKGIYDELVPDAVELLRQADAAMSTEDVVFEVAFILNLVHARKLAGTFDADVSVGLHTNLVSDSEAIYEYGRWAHAVCPEHFVVQVALTPEGLLAARRLERDGIRVNCMLGFSPRQIQLIALFARPHFFSVSLDRVDTLFKRADLAVGVVHAPGEIATMQSQRILRKLISEELAAPHTRQIAGSAREGSRIASLAGVDILTMPAAVAREFIDSRVDPASIDDRTRRLELDQELAVAEQPFRAHGGVFLRGFHTTLGAAQQLLTRDLDHLDGDRLRSVLADNHLGDLFPDLGADDRERLAAEGEIPDPEYWEARVMDRAASWDGLMTEAAIGTLAAEQHDLDARIRQMIA